MSGTGRRGARSAALLVFLLGVPGAAMAGSKTASLRIGAQVVASVNLSATDERGGQDRDRSEILMPNPFPPS